MSNSNPLLLLPPLPLLPPRTLPASVETSDMASELTESNDVLGVVRELPIVLLSSSDSPAFVTLPVVGEKACTARGELLPLPSALLEPRNALSQLLVLECVGFFASGAFAGTVAVLGATAVMPIIFSALTRPSTLPSTLVPSDEVRLIVLTNVDVPDLLDLPSSDLVPSELESISGESISCLFRSASRRWLKRRTTRTADFPLGSSLGEGKSAMRASRNTSRWR